MLAELKTAVTAAPSERRLAAMQAVVRRQAHHLRDRAAVADPGFVPRQLCLQATELGETLLAADCRTRQLASDDPGPVLQWTTRRASPGLILELGRHDRAVNAVAALPDGRVASGDDGRVLVWDPGAAQRRRVELGLYDSGVRAVAVLPDGRVASGGADVLDDRVLVWDPGDPGAGPVELGRHDRGVSAVAALADGRVVSGGWDRRVLVWDLGAAQRRRRGRVKLGLYDSGVRAVAVLPDGRVASGGDDGRVRLWDVRSSSPGSLLACCAYALVTFPSPSGARLFIGHARSGISCWEVRAAAQNTPGAPATYGVTRCSSNGREYPKVRGEWRAG